MTGSNLSTLQDFPWQDSLWAVKAGADFKSYDDFCRYLRENLPHNSQETRRRYTSLVTYRYFPNQEMDNLLTQVWRAYKDERLLADLMRVATLEREPVIAQFVVEKLLSEPPGAALSPDVPREFIEKTFGSFKENSYKRLLLTARYLGFVGRYSGKLLVGQIPTPRDALLILIHDRLAPTPRIVRVSEILAANWRLYLGIRDAGAVRQVLRQAEAAGLLARYAVMDELEQITTRYSRDEYLERALRL